MVLHYYVCLYDWNTGVIVCVCLHGLLCWRVVVSSCWRCVHTSGVRSAKLRPSSLLPRVFRAPPSHRGLDTPSRPPHDQGVSWPAACVSTACGVVVRAATLGLVVTCARSRPCIAGLFAGTEGLLHELRGVDDLLNSCAGGAMLGLAFARKQPLPVAVSTCASSHTVWQLVVVLVLCSCH